MQQQSIILPTEQLLFPFMNFTCRGMITKLSFIARRGSQELNNNIMSQNNITSWSMFSLWHCVGHSNNFTLVKHLGPLHPNQIISTQPGSRSITDERQEELFMINFNPPIQFEPNYILGLRQNTTVTVSSQSNWTPGT